jgi:pimeloyl-ACP methyl ester carboxylesterase
MDNLRTYGSEPYDLVLLHGGPGAAGAMEPVAKRISISFGILEPLILSLSINDQITELHSIIKEKCNYPVVIIGHSWGAWLAYIFASMYPGAVKKLILIGAPPFEEKYTKGIRERLLQRLTAEEKKWLLRAIDQIKAAPEKKHSIISRCIDLMIKADSFDLIPSDNAEILFYPNVFYKVWEEAEQLRITGKLIKYAATIKCPVVALHGDYDSRPAKGVEEPLSRALNNFRFTMLENCGHYPWKETNAKDILYKIFYLEIYNA